MNPVAIGLSVAGFMTALGTFGLYLSTIPRGKVPVRPIGTVLFQCVGLGLAISGVVVWSLQGGGLSGGGLSVAAVVAPAALAVMMGLGFFYLLSTRKTPIGDLRVSVGDTLLPFESTTSEGMAFKTDELAGNRILLKFFRGGW